jgi:hypothetical protein
MKGPAHLAAPFISNAGETLPGPNPDFLVNCPDGSHLALGLIAEAAQWGS